MTCRLLAQDLFFLGLAIFPVFVSLTTGGCWLEEDTWLLLCWCIKLAVGVKADGYIPAPFKSGDEGGVNTLCGDEDVVSCEFDEL